MAMLFQQVGPPVADSAFAESPLTVVYAGVLLHGPASVPPTLNGVVVMKGGQILYAGPRSDDAFQAALDGETPVEYHVACVMPGMWDVHCHFFGVLERDTPPSEVKWRWVFEDRAVKVGRDVPRLAKVLGSGFTSVREVGGMGKHLKVLVQEGSVSGPRIYHANNPIHITGGHTDLPSDVPLRCYAELMTIQDSDGCAVLGGGVDGEIDCVKAVRRNIRTGASVIKLCCSGGVMSQTAGLPTQQQFSTGEIRAMTEEAARHDRLVCAHCHSRDGVLAALSSGVKCIEHCTLADDKCIEALLEHDALMVPTRWVIEDLVGPGGIDGPKPPRLTPASWTKLKLIYDASREAHRKAIAAGVKVATGCDIFVAEGYGTSGKELGYLVELGMSPAGVVEAATVNGPLALGLQAPKSGRLEADYDADVICLDANPLEDISVLADSEHVRLVFKGGVLQKNTLCESCHT